MRNLALLFDNEHTYDGYVAIQLISCNALAKKRLRVPRFRTGIDIICSGNGRIFKQTGATEYTEIFDYIKEGKVNRNIYKGIHSTYSLAAKV